MEELNVIPPEQYVGAVESIEWIVPAVEDLLARGLAYRVPGTAGEPDGDVYFDSVAAAGPGWHNGATSRLTEEQMLPLFAERVETPTARAKSTRWTRCCGAWPATVSPSGPVPPWATAGPAGTLNAR